MASPEFDLDPWAVSYYDRLDVPTDADISMIRQAGKAASNRYHPDSTDDDSDDEAFIRVSDARQTLIDSESREEYMEFCEALGFDAGTKRYEKWLKRGEPASPSSVIEEIPAAERQSAALGSVDDSGESDTPIEDMSSRYHSSSTPGSESPTSTEIPSSSNIPSQPTTPTTPVDEPTSDADSGGIIDETTDSFDETHSAISEQTGTPLMMALDVGHPKVVETTGDVGSVEVRSDTTGFNEICISGLYDREDIYFNLDHAEVITANEEPIEAVNWVDRSEEGLIEFRYEGNSATVDLQAESDEELKSELSDGAMKRSVKADDGDGIVSTWAPKLFRVRAPESYSVRVLLTLVWAGIAISPYLTPLGVFGWLLIVAPFPRIGPWAIGSLTAYFIGASAFSLTVPTGNIRILWLVVALLISAGVLVLKLSVLEQ